jgi:glucokinase
MYLAADIGGTKSLIALVDEREVVFQGRYANDDHGSVAALLAGFVAEAELAGHRTVAMRTCLAIAGPVAGARARLTNRPWQVDAAALGAALPLGEVILVNDFAATAAGLPTLAAADCQVLQTGRGDPAAARLVLGPGTGLGVAAWLPDGDGGRVIASEGGHVAFAPGDEEQQALLRHLAAKRGRVNVEALVSGPGLAACHDFCRGATSGATLEPAEIARRALQGSDADCVRALDLFLRIFGAFAGDMALTFLARGGVFLAGGIVPKILPRLGAGGFLAAFTAKAEHANLAASFPLHAVLCEDLGLRGAIAIARNR